MIQVLGILIELNGEKVSSHNDFSLFSYVLFIRMDKISYLSNIIIISSFNQRYILCLHEKRYKYIIFIIKSYSFIKHSSRYSIEL